MEVLDIHILKAVFEKLSSILSEIQDTELVCTMLLNQYLRDLCLNDMKFISEYLATTRRFMEEYIDTHIDENNVPDISRFLN